MYCTNCGKKLKETNIYCPHCGHLIKKTPSSQPPLKRKNNLISLAQIIGIICIFGSFIFNIFIIPLAILGLIISIVAEKRITSGTILNIVAILTSILTLIFLIFIFNNLIDYAKEDNYQYPNDKPNSIIKNNSLVGTWYTYENNKISEDYYFIFNKDKTFSWQEENNIYTGTYTIETGATNQEGTKKYQDNLGYDYYSIILSPSIIITKDGNTITNNLAKVEFTIAINGEDMKATNKTTNNNYNLTKQQIEIY